MAYDALDAQTPRAVFIGNGTRGPFDFRDIDGNPIRIRDQTHLVVRRYSSVTDETGTALALNTDFTVSNTDVDAVSLTLTVAQAVLASTERLVVERLQTLDDVLSLVGSGDYSLASLGAAISVIVERSQEARRDIDRSLKSYWLSTTTAVLPASPTATKAIGLTPAGAFELLTAADLGADVLLGEGVEEALSVPFPFYNVEGYGADPLGTAAANSTAIQAVLDLIKAAGGGTAYFPNKYEATNLSIPSFTTMLGRGEAISGLKLPLAAINTDAIALNETRGTYTNTDIILSGMSFDGQGAQQTGSQTRFTELVGMSRVTRLKVDDCLFKNSGYIGLAAVGCRYADINGWGEGLGFNGTTSNGGPALFYSRPNGSYDQSSNGRIAWRARDCYWHGATVHGRKNTVSLLIAIRCQEAALFAPHDGDTVINDGLTILDWLVDGVTQRDISGSAFEIGGHNIVIGAGQGANTDHAIFVFTDVQNATVAPFSATNFNQDSKGSVPQACAIGVISGSAAPAQPRNIRAAGVTIRDDSAAATVTIANGSPGTITWTAHGRSPGDMVKLTTTGVLPTGYALLTKYFVLEDGLTKNSFSLSLTRGGAAIITSSAGSGTHTCTKATTAYGAFSITGSGDPATSIVFESSDLGGVAFTGSAYVTTKAGANCKYINNAGATDFLVVPTIAGAATIDLSSTDIDDVEISGTSFTCTSLGTANKGARRTLTFNSSGGILTHNATSLILPGGSSITIVAGDVAEFLSLGAGNWRCTTYQFTPGTFTPTFAFATPNNYSETVASANGYYRRIGNLMYVEARRVFTPTFTTSSGDATVGGLPAAAASGTNYDQTLEAQINGFFTYPTGITHPYLRLTAGAASAVLTGQGSTKNETNFAPAQMTSGSQHVIQFKGWYRV